MGAAMAPAACDTLTAHFPGHGPRPPPTTTPSSRATSALMGTGHRAGAHGHADGMDLGPAYTDCGVLIYDSAAQDAHCGRLGLRLLSLGARWTHTPLSARGRVEAGALLRPRAR